MKKPPVYDHIVSIRLTAAMIAAIAAARGGMSQADFIRAAIAEKVAKPYAR